MTHSFLNTDFVFERFQIQKLFEIPTKLNFVFERFKNQKFVEIPTKFEYKKI